MFPYDSAALYFRVLKIEKERQSQARCLQITEALGQMRRIEAIHTFQLDDQNVCDHQVRLEFADDPALVGHPIGGLSSCDTSKSQLVH